MSIEVQKGNNPVPRGGGREKRKDESTIFNNPTKKRKTAVLQKERPLISHWLIALTPIPLPISLRLVPKMAALCARNSVVIAEGWDITHRSVISLARTSVANASIMVTTLITVCKTSLWTGSES